MAPYQCNQAVLQAPKAFKQLELRLGRVLTRVLWLICSVVFTLHIFACMFHFAALLSTSEGTWVESSGIVDASSTVDLYAPCSCCFNGIHAGTEAQRQNVVAASEEIQEHVQNCLAIST